MAHLDSISYKHVAAGEHPAPGAAGKKLVIYALSTCGFCERSMRFLESQGLGYDYIFLDELDREVKNAVKEELKAKFGTATVFPYLVIDDREIVVGFTEEKWRQGLGL